MLGQRTFCFSILPLEGYWRSQQKLRKHTKLNAVLLPRFLALYKLQDFLSQKLHLCVLQTVMNFSFCEFVYFVFSHANFGHPQSPVLMPLTFNLPLLQKTLLLFVKPGIPCPYLSYIVSATTHNLWLSTTSFLRHLFSYLGFQVCLVNPHLEAIS